MNFFVRKCLSFNYCVTLVVLTRPVSLSEFLVAMTHYKCRVIEYPKCNGAVERQFVPDNKVPWSVDWEQYDPPYYTSERILHQNWSDPEIENPNFQPMWNNLDGEINRNSFIKKYEVKDKYPLNPMGRTGLKGRGALGRWGPNHAADPVVTRWKRGRDNKIIQHASSGLPILQFVGIKRRDCNEWAIPGGMVDPGEIVTSTLKREFLEEALNLLEMSPEDKEKVHTKVDHFFSEGIEMFKGYVDDPRNTDNAWIETVVHSFHDEEGTFVGALLLTAGDDAIGVKWLDISKELPLYASHSKFIKVVAEKHNAHW